LTDYRQEMAGEIQQAVELNAYTCLHKPFMTLELLEIPAKIQSARSKNLLKAG